MIPAKRSVEVEDLGEERRVKKRKIEGWIERIEKMERYLAEMVWEIQKELRDLKRELRE